MAKKKKAMTKKELLKIIEEAAKDGRTGLDLSNRGIKSLPPEIGGLKNLTKLNLYGNQLTKLPGEISKLTKLNLLDLSSNKLAELPGEITKLTNLQKLYLARNQLTKLPGKIAKLINLEQLNLSDNKLTELPKEILELAMEIKSERYTKHGILLEGNPLESPPIEIIRQGTEAVRNYFESIKKESSRVFEAKLLIVGEGGVGKTCVMKRLMAPDKPIDEKELTTEGIDINRWFIVTKKTRYFRINFWDFGGQEIYHATHQFFLTKRSLYLFVWEARKDYDITSFDYWLNVVRLLSDNSPVIVVLNKIDERIKTIDEKTWQSRFKNIVWFGKVSALKGTGIEILGRIISEHITELPHVGNVLPTVWIDIRKELERLKKNYISYDDYKSVCKQFGLDEEKAEYLRRFYHDLGVFLHFLDNPVLRELVFLKPDWATNAVYKVVDTKEIQKNYGKFEFKQLRKIWDDYPEDKYAVLLELMKKFELCFQLPRTQTYIVPELLRPSKPYFKWDYMDNLRVEYRYDFMPAGIINRFIVRTHDIIKEDIYWKSGVVLQRENTEALVVSERLNRKISIWVRSEKKKELLAIIRREIDYIHKTLNYPDVKEMIPCICSKCVVVKQPAEEPHFYEYETLCRFRSKGKIACAKSTEDVPIGKLLGDYGRPEGKRKMEHRYREDMIGKIDVSPRIEVSPKFEPKVVIKQPPTVEAPQKPPWYKTWKVIWAAIGGIILLLGGIWTAIQIYDYFRNQ